MMIQNWVKYIFLLILRFFLDIFNVFPIKNNRIVFYSFNGKQYSCNPRRISECLNEAYPDKNEIIWAFKNPHEMISIIPNNVKTVKYRSLRYYYYAKTARVIVQNVQGFGELRRRKGQDVIQTWHASNGYKQQGNYTGVNRRLELLYHKDYTYVLSGSESMTKRRIRGTMGFTGTILSGTPRMDEIINREHPEWIKKVHEYFRIKEDIKILLYAPTWRKDRNIDNYGLNYSIVKESLEARFGGIWVIAVRLHPNVYKHSLINESYVLDATKYPDMQELLCAADGLISDYSSCIWDYSFRYKPCLLYCGDLKTYGNERNFDIPIKKWHFPVSTSMEELEQEILSFDEEKFRCEMEIHHNEMGSLEDGKATSRVCDLINDLVTR